MTINPELLQAEQIERYFYLPLGALSFAATGTSDIVTSELTALASGNVPPVPLQVSTAKDVQGFVTSPPFNKCLLQDSTTKQAFDDGFGNEVFGRITEATAVFTLSFFAIVSGTESSVDIGSRTIDFFPIYNFGFSFFANEAFIRTNARIVGDDPTDKGGFTRRDTLAVTATNTIADLPKTPITGTVRLYVNPGGPYTEGVSFSISGKAVTWIPANAGFDIRTTYTVKAVYNTFES